MCEQTELNYLDGDIVWVKLGPCWWPGEVRDVSKLPPEIAKAFKKQPIAVVKFFQEDQYEYVKNINHIYKYNCRKKNDFIRKGLDMHRAKNTFMDKFPADVCHAETLTGGDPDIITSDEFAPEQRPSYSAIFGSPSPKKTTPKNRTSFGTPKSSQSVTPPQRRITHPRFLGKSDHEIRILEQSTPTTPSSHYTCHICGFESTRLNVIVLHNRSHSNGTFVSPSKQKTKKGSTARKGKRPKSFNTTTSIDEDLELIRQGVVVSTDDSSDSDADEKQSKSKGASGKRKNSKATNNASKKAKVSNICNNLLADWGDSDSNEESVLNETDKLNDTNKLSETNKSDEAENETEAEKSATIELEQPKSNAEAETKVADRSVHSELLADWDDKNSDEELTQNSNIVAEEQKTDIATKVDAAIEKSSSCFDFKDEEDSAVLEKSPGRKIPRVIPSKRVSKDMDENMEVDKHVEENTTVDRQKEEVSKSESEEVKDGGSSKKEFAEPDLIAFKNILDETEVPDLSTIPGVKEPFDKKNKKVDDPSSNTDKTNGALKKDKLTAAAVSSSEPKESEHESKVSEAPKKRIVRNFEEFENLLNERKQAEEEAIKCKSTLEVSKLKSQLMSKLTDSPVKQSAVESEDAEEPAETLTAIEKEETVGQEAENDDQSKNIEQKKITETSEEKVAEPDNISHITEVTKEPETETQTEMTVEEETGNSDLEERIKTHVIRAELSVEMEVEPTTVEETADEKLLNEPEKESSTSELPDSEPVTSELITSEPTTLDSTLSEPTVSEHIVSEPMVSERAVSKPILEPTVSEPAIEEEQENTEIKELNNAENSLEVKEDVEVDNADKNDTPSPYPPSLETDTSCSVKDEAASMEEEKPDTAVSEKSISQMSTKELLPLEPPVEEPKVQEPTEESPHVQEEEVADIQSELPPESEVASLPSEEVPLPQESAENSRPQKMLVDISDICIDNVDNLSGLSTLAAVSELTGNLYEKTEPVPTEPVVTETVATEIKETAPEISQNTPIPSNDTESREVATPVQDEIPELQVQKPVATLANFSMDFSDSNSESTLIKTDKEETPPENVPETVTTNTDTEEAKVETKEPLADTSELKETPVVATTNIPSDFESIESEIEKITSIETNSDKLNSFPENISQVTQDSMNIDPSPITYPDFSLPETSTIITTSSESNEFPTKLNEPVVNIETTLESEIAKLTDTSPEAETVVQETQQNTSSSKLLEILTDSKNAAAAKKSDHLPTEPPVPTIARTVITSGTTQKVHMVITGDSKTISKKFDPKTSKFVIKSATSKAGISGKSNKPIILSEKIIKPVTETENVSVRKVTSKRSYQDVEDIDTFIIQKPSKKPNSGDSDQQDTILTPKTETIKFKGGIRARGKPKIIEQTIIKAADVVQQVPVSTTESQPLLDDAMFDINSMPIVLSDQILTPESIENMPVVMTDLMPTSSVSTAAVTTVQTVITEKPQQQTIAVKRGGAIQQVKLLNKSKVTTSQPESSVKMSQNVVVKNIMPRGLSKNQKVYQTGSKLLKNNPAVITQPGKPGKFIILPSTTTTSTTGSKYTVGKRLTAVKNMSSLTNPTTSKVKAVQSVASEPTGNKIMIVTNQQGVQSRVLLTPAQQKMLGCKMPATKIAKGTTQIKGGIMQKSILTSKGTIIGPVNSSGGLKSPTLTSQTIVTSKGQLFAQTSQTLVTSEGQVLTPITQQQLKSLKSEQHKLGKKVQMQSRILLPDKSGESSQKSKMNIVGQKTKTILIKGSQGQALKKLQSPMSESKNIVLSSAGHKSNQLMSLGSQQIPAGLSGKQVMVTSKGQIIKSDVKTNSSKQTMELMQKVKPAPKTPLGTPTRIVSKPSSRTQQMLLSPVSAPNTKQLSTTVGVPPLAPITGQVKKETFSSLAKQNEQKLATETKEKVTEAVAPGDKPGLGEQKQPNQLIIQDTMGNQTTVTEGQILALPSGETIDGQPQSYMLVTVDESGNLVPISNDTLMSLDPSLALGGGDMSNIVLQIDQGMQDNQVQETKPSEALSAELPAEEPQFTAATQPVVEGEQHLLMENQQLILSDQNLLTSTEQHLVAPEQQQQQQVFVDKDQDTFIPTADETQVISTDPALIQDAQQTAVTCSINSGDSSQQLIITGDPESTQKFLASLSEGNTDLSSLLSGTDGNIIINTDGQQILLNTDSENQILLSVNSDNLGLIQSNTETEATQNMYVTQQAIKNQDILAAALADTDVFQQEGGDKHATNQALTKVSNSSQPQLSPNSSLYPMNVGNVLETSLTLGSPIMTPLEVPSVNNKKISSDVESTLISQVPSSLELPITITDPNISQTVSQQVMLGNDLQTNLDLPITMSDNGITAIRSSEMNSPSFVYSLPTLDENTDMEQKRVFTESSPVITSDSIYSTALTGSMSMPLLTEEPEITPVEQEQIAASGQADVAITSSETTTTTETISTESVITESDQRPNFTTISDSLPTTMTEKISSELQIGPIEEELGLNPTDICSSLSEPPPGMFDKSSFSLNTNYLSSKEEEEESSNPPTSVNDSSILHEPISSLPLLSDNTEQETRNSDLLTTTSSSGVTEKSDEPNLDLDYGVSESSDQHSASEPVNQDVVPRSDLSETPNSELNSPRLDIDENSCEIPIQPPIITNLSDSFDDKDFRVTEENGKKRTNEEEELNESEVKKSKLSSACD